MKYLVILILLVFINNLIISNNDLINIFNNIDYSLILSDDIKEYFKMIFSLVIYFIFFINIRGNHV